MIQAIKRTIPQPVRMNIRRHFPAMVKTANTLARNAAYVIPDTIELLTGKRDRLTPPRRLNFVGGGDFKKIGEEFFHHFVDIGGLKPEDNVLEVGCGIGRMAIPLMGYLKNGGSYDGFDIVSHGIRWCQKKITRRAHNFHFQLSDIFNYGYNPTGKYRAAEYRFPYDDESFDFVFLTSVFTHMLPRDMEHYFSEIGRVLRKGGRSFITFFLLNEDSRDLIHTGASTIGFKHQIDGTAAYPEYKINDPDIPEAAVAYPEKYIAELHELNHLHITGPLRYGSWCGRKEFLSFQDIISAVKLTGTPAGGIF